MRELQGAGWQRAQPVPGGYSHRIAGGPPPPALPMDGYPQFPANFSLNAQPVYPAGFQGETLPEPTFVTAASQGFKEQDDIASSFYSAATYGMKDASGVQPMQNIYEGAVDVQYREKSVVSERLLE